MNWKEVPNSVLCIKIALSQLFTSFHMGHALFIVRSYVLLVSCHSVADLPQEAVRVRQTLPKASVVCQGDKIGMDCSRGLGALGGDLQAKPCKPLEQLIHHEWRPRLCPT